MGNFQNWIKWDLDSRLGLKMNLFFSEFGSNGYGFFKVLVEDLYRAENTKLYKNIQTIQNYTKLCKINFNDATAYLDKLIELELFKTDGEFFWSPRVNEELGLRETHKKEVSDKRRKAVSARWNKEKIQTDTNGYKAVQKIQTDTNDTRLDKNRLDKNRLDNNIYNTQDVPEPKKIKKSKYTKFDKQDFKLPAKWGDQALYHLQTWIEYKSEAGHPKILRSYQAEVDKYAEEPRTFARLADRAIQKGWQGLNEHLPLDAPQGGGFKTKAEKEREDFERTKQMLYDFAMEDENVG